MITHGDGHPSPVFPKTVVHSAVIEEIKEVTVIKDDRNPEVDRINGECMRASELATKLIQELQQTQIGINGFAKPSNFGPLNLEALTILGLPETALTGETPASHAAFLLHSLNQHITNLRSQAFNLLVVKHEPPIIPAVTPVSVNEDKETGVTTITFHENVDQMVDHLCVNAGEGVSVTEIDKVENEDEEVIIMAPVIQEVVQADKPFLSKPVFELKLPEECDTPLVKLPEKEGWSTTTKVMVGVGAALVVAGGYYAYKHFSPSGVEINPENLAQDYNG